jgi:hypothetical protein
MPLQKARTCLVASALNVNTAGGVLTEAGGAELASNCPASIRPTTASSTTGSETEHHLAKPHFVFTTVSQ